MIEENRPERSPDRDVTSATPGDMAEALAAVKASSPSLGAALDAAGLTPDHLAAAHDRATHDEPDAATLAQEESDERG